LISTHWSISSWTMELRKIFKFPMNNHSLLVLQPDYLHKSLTLKTDLILLKNTRVNEINMIWTIYIWVYAIYLTAF
jgi:hypothetical protein